MSSPTARTLAECRKRGWVCQTVERYNPYAKRRVDLFDVIDLVVCVPDPEIPNYGHILGIQATTMANKAARIEKIHQSVKAQAWMNAGGRLEVWSWRKLKVKRGGKAVRWELDVENIEPQDHP